MMPPRLMAHKIRKSKSTDNEKLHPGVEPGTHPVVQGIMAKKMSKGGMVEDVDHDEPESMAVSPEWSNEDFLSDEEDDHALDLTYPDPDHKEDTEGMDPEKKKRHILEMIFGRM